MRARHRERCEHPDLLVVDEVVRAREPLPGFLIIRLETLDVRRTESAGPLHERWNLRVVQHDETRPPGSPLQVVTVLVEFVLREALADNTLPWHASLLVNLCLPTREKSCLRSNA